jgi:hypothetical protein
MKATILLAVLFVVALGAFAAAPAVIASGFTVAAEHAPRSVEPAWMLLSGATLLGVASAVRRYVP